MAFVKASGNVVSFAETDDVMNREIRVFNTNESLNDVDIDELLVRATQRILAKLRTSDWWRSYYVNRSTSTLRTVADIPELNANLILLRHVDFTDLCVATAMADYVLPMVTNFGSEDDANRQKMAWYAERADTLFNELVVAGDWYDFDASGVVTSVEKEPSNTNPRRIR